MATKHSSYESLEPPDQSTPSHRPLVRQLSKENEPYCRSKSISKKPLQIRVTDPGSRVQGEPLSPVHVNAASESLIPQAISAQIEDYASLVSHSRTPSRDRKPQRQGQYQWSARDEATTQYLYDRHHQGTPDTSRHLQGQRVDSPNMGTSENKGLHSRHPSDDVEGDVNSTINISTPLQYHHMDQNDLNQTKSMDKRASAKNIGSLISHSKSPSGGRNIVQETYHLAPNRSSVLSSTVPRPSSAYSWHSDIALRERDRSPQLSPNRYARTPSTQGRRSPDSRPISYVDLLNVPYPQPPPAPMNLDNTYLRTAVGNNASLLSTKKTLDMYRANVKKTNDPAVQYEFAVFMIGAAQDLTSNSADNIGLDGAQEEHGSSTESQSELLHEARQILQRLSDKSYPFAQYYLADGYASGLLNKGKEDNDHAFPLFIAASKHGHAEAGYRAALCYEFGWGTRKDPFKAVQFYRQSASKNHPGAMTRLGRACLTGDMGLDNRYREGLKWLKRAAESADFQYNSAPYELGLLHETGYGEDVFQDQSYAAQLFTQSADLGHAEANYRLGDAYEHGKLNCPKDPALSVHFYTGAAQRGHSVAMMALCAWYMVGAEPVLDKDENEAYEWARKAAECGEFLLFCSDLDIESLLKLAFCT